MPTEVVLSGRFKLFAKGRVVSELLKFLQAKNIRYVDTAQHIFEHYTDRFEGLSIPDGHLNSRGNLMVAEALAKQLAATAMPGS